MPLSVKIKIAAAVLAALVVALILFELHFVLGLIFVILALLYTEMINPRWNFFGPAILDVKKTALNAVAITFDDGPSEWTRDILRTLKEENVKATFFLLGANIDRHPEIAQQIVRDGHVIGCHGYSHAKYHLKSLDFIRDDLDQAFDAFQRAGLPKPTLIRFPHGVKNIFAVKEALRRNLKICSWGLGVWDSKMPGEDIIAERAKALKDGEILLLHDAYGAAAHPDRSQTAAALPKIIRHYKERGLGFVTLS